jgi:ligand-binding SRPBCC domain-containing protein
MMILPAASNKRQGVAVPIFEASSEFACTPHVLYDFLIQPNNLTRLSPPDINLRLIEGPERVLVGSRLIVEGRYLGMRQKLTIEIVALDPGRLVADEQIKGPFRRLRQERRLSASSVGVLLEQRVEFEPPGGLLGLLATPQRIREYLADMHDYGVGVMRQILTPGEIQG